MVSVSLLKQTICHLTAVETAEEDYMVRPDDSYCLKSDYLEFSKAYENKEYDDWDTYITKRED